MSEPASLTTGIASRYAAAVFDLALEQGALATLDSDVAALDQALKDSQDLRDLIASPVFSRLDMEGAITAIARQMGLSVMLQNTLALMAQKRRLFVLPRLVTVLRDKIAAHRGEATAEVTSARPLTEAQAADLARTLSDRVGKTVKLVTNVDDSLIGGLVVKVGSTMIDTSIRSRLAALQNTMKEVG